MNEIQQASGIKALIVYQSKYGNTASIAVAIGRGLEKKGLEVQVADVKRDKIPDVSMFDVVILGSGIAMAKWYKDLRTFLRKNEAILAGKIVAYFVSCASVVPPCDREASYRIYAERAAQYSKITPATFGVFGCDYSHVKSQGALHKYTMPALLKNAIAKGVDASKSMDFRDWKAIEAWTVALVTLITALIPVAEAK